MQGVVHWKSRPGVRSSRYAQVWCHGGCINLYYQNVIPSPYTKWYHKSYYIIVWVLMEIVYSIFIGMISSKIVGMIDGIVLQCRRDTN